VRILIPILVPPACLRRIAEAALAERRHDVHGLFLFAICSLSRAATFFAIRLSPVSSSRSRVVGRNAPNAAVAGTGAPRGASAGPV